MSLFNHLTPATIGAAIRKAKDRVIYSAPSLTDDVASALIMAKDKLGDDNLTVILDFSEHLFRLGYGTCESVKMLVDKGVKVRKQAQEGRAVSNTNSLRLVLSDITYCYKWSICKGPCSNNRN